ncbi:TPA: hypothetical protein ACJEU7_002687 [Acinetobacter baumannii]|uniref:hypothetical protein n=1 Tax=Acinetobacter baumannii TaxID=470 RepID=UPI001249E3F4|nr:hypothetical protein [Acinetobacter baumannii]KAB1665131.1 hypothetical protein F8B05_18995 [Acinetobacter baumannii]MCX3034213.1 hypothetical protein [Acinetobacter baumannii]
MSNLKLKQKLAKIESIQGSQIKTEIEQFIDGQYYGTSCENRYWYFLGASETLLRTHNISEDDYYEIIKVLDMAKEGA